MNNSDNVNHPAHYTQGKIECIDYIEDKLTAEEFRGYIKGNVIKYLTREKHKNGDEDIRKAAWYLNRLIRGSMSRKQGHMFRCRRSRTPYIHV